MTTAEMLIEEGKTETALEMIKEGLEDAIIVRCTKLTAAQVAALRQDGKLSGNE